MDITISLIAGLTFGIIIFLIFGKEIRGPNSNIFRYKIFKDNTNNKCYMFEPKVYMCKNKQ